MKGYISIHRMNSGNVRIELDDDASNKRFISVDITPDNFAKVITGLSYTPMEFEVSSLDVVGKTRIVEARTIQGNHGNADDAEKFLRENASEDGWEVICYLRSQKSIESNPDGSECNYTYHYTVEKFI